LTSIFILKELYRRRVLVVLSVVLATSVSLLAIFNVSFVPPSISKRYEVSGKGSIQILVDSARSPIADAQRDLTGLTARANVFARFIAGGTVIKRIARASGIPAKEIDIEDPGSLPDAPNVAQQPVQRNQYGIAISPVEGLPILSVVTRAPTVREARAMAAAAPSAVAGVVRSIQRQQRTPINRRVQFRVLGPAKAGLVDDALGKKIALVLFIVLLAFFMVLILGLPRLVTAWRAVEPDQGFQESGQDSDVLRLHAARGGVSGGDSSEGARARQQQET
jgi:hypothetical protein